MIKRQVVSIDNAWKGISNELSEALKRGDGSVKLFVEKMKRLRQESAQQMLAKIGDLSDVAGIELRSENNPNVFVIISRDPHVRGTWRGTRMDQDGPMGHRNFTSTSLENVIKNYNGIRTEDQEAEGLWSLGSVVRYKDMESRQMAASVLLRIAASLRS